MENTWQEAISARTSRRSYVSGELPSNTLEKVSGIIESVKGAPFGTEADFQLIRKYSEENSRLKLGTYGFISGARYFIAGQVEPGVKAFIDYGYLLEKIILTLTINNLGTCWLGGTFDRGEFAIAVNLKDGYIIPAITPVGIPTENRSLGDRLIRFGAGSHNRKAWESLFFHEKPGKALSKNEAGQGLSAVLEMVRIAPSASNLQPWRFLKKGNSFDIYLQRKPGYKSRFGGVDLQMIDIGIAVCHFDLVCRELGIETLWEISGTHEEIDGWEYTISVKFHLKSN